MLTVRQVAAIDKFRFNKYVSLCLGMTNTVKPGTRIQVSLHHIPIGKVQFPSYGHFLVMGTV